MDNDKSQENDGITKKLYIKFWDVVKELLCASIQGSFVVFKYLSKTSYYKINWEKNRDKMLIKNWWPILLLNVDIKLISKVLSSCLRSVISTIVNEYQVAYINNMFISESSRLKSDVLEITNSLDTDGLLMTVDVDKAFDSINHSFFVCMSKNFGFANEFWKWIQILRKNPESCVINDGKTTLYFKLERRPRQWDPISVYLFIIALEAVFSLIKANPDIEGLQFLSHTFLHSAFAHDTTFLVRNEKSATEVIVKHLISFLFFLTLKSIMQNVKLLALVSERGLRQHSVE